MDPFLEKCLGPNLMFYIKGFHRQMKKMRYNDTSFNRRSCSMSKKSQVKQLAYRFGELKKKEMPNNWIVNEAAGEDWLRGFRRRNNNLALRMPESTSIARAMGFNRPAVSNFFQNLKEVLLRDGTITPQNIWNLDETGISTVVKPGKIFGEKGTKQIGRISSGERGATVTMCCCVNSIGNALPPVYVFPRVNFKKHMFKRCPNWKLWIGHFIGMDDGCFVPPVHCNIF